ncbi:hypothetical protein [Silvanigrella sp.]|uniref:hypothetical protein n=1 Tax=Silvanigrella sp. TaxID=2024976 RepID=UPI0037C84699|nr:hypothetical protein [Silvanigrellaceae bacterium]
MFFCRFLIKYIVIIGFRVTESGVIFPKNKIDSFFFILKPVSSWSSLFAASILFSCPAQESSSSHEQVACLNIDINKNFPLEIRG